MRYERTFVLLISTEAICGTVFRYPVLSSHQVVALDGRPGKRSYERGVGGRGERKGMLRSACCRFQARGMCSHSPCFPQPPGQRICNYPTSVDGFTVNLDVTFSIGIPSLSVPSQFLLTSISLPIRRWYLDLSFPNVSFK
jgi:hypothetical protein